jgi:predicted ATPase
MEFGSLRSRRSSACCAVAATAEAVLRATTGVCILATSREPPRAAGEWLLRLPSLEVPSGAAR